MRMMNQCQFIAHSLHLAYYKISISRSHLEHILNVASYLGSKTTID